MLKQIEGSQAMAEGIALCRPEVICAYPITPQTHIVEKLGELVKSGELSPCEFINVESEFAALSVAIGSSAGGARSYTATASQGLLFMAEAVFNASGLGLPIVMTVGNRAIGAPINIWNDHSDSMSLRDCGWIQIFAETNQEAIDLHIIAFRLAEELSIPVMVCVDGFILTHAYERLEIPEQSVVDAYLPPFEPRHFLDIDNPLTMGAMVGPDAYMEVRYLAHKKQAAVFDRLPDISNEFKQLFGRESGGLFRTYQFDDCETVIFALGSVNGTIKDAVDELREQGVKVGVLTLICYRPFPSDALRQALKNKKRIIVVEKALALGMGGIVAADLKIAMMQTPAVISTVVAGLGGRSITKKSLINAIHKTLAGELEELSFLDLNEEVAARELKKEEETIEYYKNRSRADALQGAK